MCASDENLTKVITTKKEAYNMCLYIGNKKVRFDYKMSFQNRNTTELLDEAMISISLKNRMMIVGINTKHITTKKCKHERETVYFNITQDWRKNAQNSGTVKMLWLYLSMNINH
jgi:hypothetical protein